MFEQCRDLAATLLRHWMLTGREEFVRLSELLEEGAVLAQAGDAESIAHLATATNLLSEHRRALLSTPQPSPRGSRSRPDAAPDESR